MVIQLVCLYNLCMVWQLSESVSNLCLCFPTRASIDSQQVRSVSVCVNSDQVTKQSSRCKLSDCCQSKRKCEQLCVHKMNSHENLTLRHNRYFDIENAKLERQHEAMHVTIQINEICSSHTGLCSSRITCPQQVDQSCSNSCCPQIMNAKLIFCFFRKAEKNDFMPVSYITFCSWQGQRQFLASLL